MTARRAIILATGALALSACDGSGGTKEAEPSAPSGTASPSLSAKARATGLHAPTPAPVVLGPSGFGALKLGMTTADAKATGQIVLTAAPHGAGCGTFELKSHLNEGVGGFVSPRYGVASIAARPGMRTPEGIGLGSTLARVKRAYPHLLTGVNGSSTPVPGNAKAVYSFLVTKDKVKELFLDLTPQDCHN